MQRLVKIYSEKKKFFIQSAIASIIISILLLLPLTWMWIILATAFFFTWMLVEKWWLRSIIGGLFFPIILAIELSNLDPILGMGGLVILIYSIPITFIAGLTITIDPFIKHEWFQPFLGMIIFFIFAVISFLITSRLLLQY